MVATPTSLTRQTALVALLAGSRVPLCFKAIKACLPSIYGGRAAAAEKLFDRDLESLRAWGFPVALRGEGAQGYVLLAEGDALLPLAFSLRGDEAAALANLLREPILYGQLDPIVHQALARLLAFHGPLDLATDLAEQTKSKMAMATRLFDMANRSLACCMTYHHQDKPDRRRVVSPLGLELHLGQAYLAAICHESGAPKAFRLDRIGRLEQAKEPYREPDQGFDLQAFFNENRARYQARSDARVRVTKAEAWRLRERYPWAVESQGPDGALMAHFPVTDEAAFFSLLLAFGPHATLLGPPPLRRAFALFMRAQ